MLPTSYNAKLRARIIAALGEVCAECGTTLGLEIDHKEPGRGGKRWRREQTWKQDIENLELRCRPCHQLKTQEDYKKHGWRFGFE